MPRLDNAACPICMDSLFGLKDDLDEIMPIATPDCGHVFHEKCLLDWFSNQAKNYLAAIQDNDLTENDAPAECPQCRTECFADPETGKPSIHRLYINFEATSNPPSSQPVSSSPARWNTPDKHLMALSRRAKGLAAELGGFSAESHEEEVMGTLGRIKTFQKDVVGSKAASAFKGYIGGLTVAMNKLREGLEEHPLIPALMGQLETTKQEYTILQAEFPRSVERAVRAAVEVERKKADKEIRKANKDRELMQRELEKEQVARVAAKRAASEREVAQDTRIRELERLLEREKEDRTATSHLVTERTRLLKMYQAKAESRKDLKRKLEEQAETIESLNAKLAGGSGASSESHSQSQAQVEVDLDEEMELETEDEADISVQTFHDDSLEIDMDEAPRAGRSTTARSYVFNSDGRLSKPSKTISTGSKYFTEKNKRVLVAASSPIAPSPKRRSVVDITDMTDSSPESLRAALLVTPKPNPRTPLRSRDENSRSMLDFLGIQGKGKQKGLVLGAKAKRRA